MNISAIDLNLLLASSMAIDLSCPELGDTACASSPSNATRPRCHVGMDAKSWIGQTPTSAVVPTSGR